MTQIKDKVYYDIDIKTILALLDEYEIFGDLRLEFIHKIKRLFSNISL
jgi:hypothetical protein